MTATERDTGGVGTRRRAGNRYVWRFFVPGRSLDTAPGLSPVSPALKHLSEQAHVVACRQGESYLDLPLL